MTTRMGTIHTIARTIQSQMWYGEIKTKEELQQAIRMEELGNMIHLTDPDEDDVNTVKDSCEKVLFELKGYMSMDCENPFRSAKKCSATGVWYEAKTPDRLIAVLEGLKTKPRSRVKIFFGDPDTCELLWTETGYVGQTTGEKPCLILVHNLRSTGGGALNTELILRIDYSNKKTCHNPTIYTKST